MYRLIFKFFFHYLEYVRCSEVFFDCWFLIHIGVVGERNFLPMKTINVSFPATIRNLFIKKMFFGGDIISYLESTERFQEMHAAQHQVRKSSRVQNFANFAI